MPKDREPKSTPSEIALDMKLYFNEMFKVLRFQGQDLSLAGMNMGRSTFDMVRELLITSVGKIGKLDPSDSEDIWRKGRWSFYSEMKTKIDARGVIPKSKLPEKYEELFRNMKTLYFLAMEKVGEKNSSEVSFERQFSYEGTAIGVPVELTCKMLDEIVDVNMAEAEWNKIKGDKDKVRKLYVITKWMVDDLR